MYANPSNIAAVATAATYIAQTPPLAYDYQADLPAELTIESVAAQLLPLAQVAGFDTVNISQSYCTKYGSTYHATAVKIKSVEGVALLRIGVKTLAAALQGATDTLHKMTSFFASV